MIRWIIPAINSSTDKTNGIRTHKAIFEQKAFSVSAKTDIRIEEAKRIQA
ncbi:MAG: hypothetical protein V2A54_13950 [Bacteroidota bacterium]